MMVYLIILPFLLFVIFAVVYIIIARQKTRRDMAMGVITGRAASSSHPGVNEQDQLSQRREAMAKKLKEHEARSHKKNGKDEDGKKQSETVYDVAAMAGISLSLQRFLMISAGIGLACFLAALLAGQAFYIALMLGVIGGMGGPKIAFRFLAGRRQKKFLEDFADVLETIVRMLKAGMPVVEAISMCSREFEGPVKEEMSKIYDEQKIGVPLYEAVANAAQRMPLPEMQMFATSVGIQQQTGASLSEVLSNLARVIRARAALKRKVVALSAEAKYSAGIIGALPIFVTVALYVMNPDYISLLFTDSFGNLLLAAGTFWMGIGIFIMREMINFKV